LKVRRADLNRLSFSGASFRQEVDKVLMVKTWTDQDEEYVHTLDIIAKRARIRTAEFNGSSAQDVRRALGKYRVIVIPELEESGEETGQVAAEAGPALRKYVQEGGVIICCGGDANIQFLSQSGLVPCQGGSGDRAGTVAKKHPIVQGVSGAVPPANATFAISTTAGKKMLGLLVAQGGGIIVGVTRLGAGAVVYCGWDYYESQEPQQKILANAVRWAASQDLGSGGEP
jgi:hypothetical protein